MSGAWLCGLAWVWFVLFCFFRLLLDSNADIVSLWLGFYYSEGRGFFGCLCEKMFNMWENRDIFVWDIAVKFNSLPIIEIFYLFPLFTAFNQLFLTTLLVQLSTACSWFSLAGLLLVEKSPNEDLHDTHKRHFFKNHRAFDWSVSWSWSLGLAD